MNAFDKKDELPIFGRVVDLSGSLITAPATPITVDLLQPYGKGCTKNINVPVTGGFFEAKMSKMSDARSFKTKVKLNSGTEWLKIEQHLDYANYISTTELFL